MAVKELKRAKKLLQAKKYHEVLRLLEPQTFRFRESYTFYYFLGIACVNTNDISGGTTYLKRADTLKTDGISAKLGLAYVYLRRNEAAEAISQYLRVLELDPANKIAHQGLNMLKNSADAEEFVDFSESPKINGLLPKLNKGFPFLVVILPPLLILLAFAGIYFLPGILEKDRGTPLSRIENPSVLELGTGEKLVESGGQVEFILTEKQISDSYALALQSFNKFEDNAAQKEINRILLSNASESVKEKVRIMQGYLKPPDFLSYKGDISYGELIKTPELYRNCYIRWKGLIGNLSMGEDRITFDLLVGYQEKKVLEGVAPVTLYFGAVLRDGDPVELIALVSEINPLALEAVGIRPIRP